VGNTVLLPTPPGCALPILHGPSERGVQPFDMFHEQLRPPLRQCQGEKIASPFDSIAPASAHIWQLTGKPYSFQPFSVVVGWVEIIGRNPSCPPPFDGFRCALPILRGLSCSSAAHGFRTKMISNHRPAMLPILSRYAFSCSLCSSPARRLELDCAGHRLGTASWPPNCFS
jgi:hypothetical protein